MGFAPKNSEGDKGSERGEEKEHGGKTECKVLVRSEQRGKNLRGEKRERKEVREGKSGDRKSQNRINQTT